jgi:hypothetical protein
MPAADPRTTTIHDPPTPELHRHATYVVVTGG